MPKQIEMHVKLKWDAKYETYLPWKQVRKLNKNHSVFLLLCSPIPYSMLWYIKYSTIYRRAYQMRRQRIVMSQRVDAFVFSVNPVVLSLSHPLSLSLLIEYLRGTHSVAIYILYYRMVWHIYMGNICSEHHVIWLRDKVARTLN